MTGAPRLLLVLLTAALAAAAPSAVAARPGSAPSGPAATGRPAVTAGPPVDYVAQLPRLSAPRYETVREPVTIRSPLDGTLLYAEVVRPDVAGRFPVLLELSPYHGTLDGRDGTDLVQVPRDTAGRPVGLTGYFAPRGYAVVIADLRGTGRSGGCLDHLGPKDQADAKAVVEWAADQRWSSGRVGMVGHSYVGSTPQMAAAQRPRGLVTIVPSAGFAAMYHHQFQDGVPYFAHWVGPVAAYESLAVARHLPATGVLTGDDFGNNTASTGCGATQSAAVTGEALASGQEVDWHRERDFREGATAWRGPVFVLQGVNDLQVRPTGLDWFHARGGRPGDKAWIGQWGHDTEDRGLQTTAVLHAWFDKHLLQRPGVSTGPPAEVFLNDGRVLTARAWPPAPSRRLVLRTHADGRLDGSPGSDAGSVEFVADARGFQQEGDTGKAAFSTGPLPADLTLVGIPQLDLRVSLLGQRVHLIGTLYDVDGAGARRRISVAGFAVQPELREGLESVTPVVPGEPMRIPLVGQAQAHVLEKGHRLVLEITSSHPDKVPTLATGAVVSVLTDTAGTTLSLPVLDGARTYPDVDRRREG